MSENVKKAIRLVLEGKDPLDAINKAFSGIEDDDVPCDGSGYDSWGRVNVTGEDQPTFLQKFSEEDIPRWGGLIRSIKRLSYIEFQLLNKLCSADESTVSISQLLKVHQELSKALAVVHNEEISGVDESIERLKKVISEYGPFKGFGDKDKRKGLPKDSDEEEPLKDDEDDSEEDGTDEEDDDEEGGPKNDKGSSSGSGWNKFVKSASHFRKESVEGMNGMGIIKCDDCGKRIERGKEHKVDGSYLCPMCMGAAENDEGDARVPHSKKKEDEESVHEDNQSREKVFRSYKHALSSCGLSRIKLLPSGVWEATRNIPRVGRVRLSMRIAMKPSESLGLNSGRIRRLSILPGSGTGNPYFAFGGNDSITVEDSAYSKRTKRRISGIVSNIITTIDSMKL